MSKSKTGNSRALRRAAFMAAAGIAAVTGVASNEATAATNEMMAGHAMMPSHIMVNAGGVTIHSDALANALMRNKMAAVQALQSRFPGLRPDQVSVGAGGMVSFRMGAAVFNKGLQAADNGSCGNILCNSLRLPNGGEMMRPQ